MRIIKCDRCGKDISDQGSPAGGFTIPRKLAMILIPQDNKNLLPIPTNKPYIDLCEDCDNFIYNEIFGKHFKEKEKGEVE